jgi:transcriptional regulator with AAA-type ATPase domain
MLPHELKKVYQEHKKASKEFSWEPDFGNSKTEKPFDGNIQQLKLLIDLIVHIHNGAFPQKNILVLKKCGLCLKHETYHKQILKSFQSSQNLLIFENNQIIAFIHPSLFVECTLAEQEESTVDKDRLEKLRLNNNVGVKTKFLAESPSLVLMLMKKFVCSKNSFVLYA